MNALRKKNDLNEELDLTIKFSALMGKEYIESTANVTQWSNYLPQRAEIWIIQRSHLAPQRGAKNTVNAQPNHLSSTRVITKPFMTLMNPSTSNDCP